VAPIPQDVCLPTEQANQAAGQPAVGGDAIPKSRGTMIEYFGPEVDTLTIRIPIRLQRRGGRKLS
jgi:hypothetical protein